jgi:hypothetical protein
MQIKKPPRRGNMYRKNPPPLAPRARLVSCTCVPQNPAAPFGSVSNGTITLSASLITGKYVWVEPALGDEGVLVPSIWTGEANLEFHLDHMIHEPEHATNVNQDDRTICTIWMATSNAWEWGGREYALVLERVIGAGPHVYRRLGMLVASTSEADYLSKLFDKACTVEVTIV